MYFFKIGETVWFTKEAQREIIPVQIWISIRNSPFSFPKVEALCIVDDCLHEVSSVEVFPQEEWANLNHFQLLTLDGDPRKKVAGHMVEPMFLKYDHLLR